VDVVGESLGGEYTPLIVDGLKLGMLLFILREVCFFGAFF
jgi:heme/copper-type cytochrome/quinol oxidase subunit 3